MKKTLVLAFALIIALSLAACKKETAQPLIQPAMGNGSALPADHPSLDPGAAMPTTPQERQVVVPDDVKGKWDSIILTIADKATNTSRDVTVKIGGEYAIEGSNIKIKADAFLPDFIMEGTVITSRSAETNNPAARIVVTEGGQEIFASWVYSNHPSIHPFQHEKYGITLKSAKKSG